MNFSMTPEELGASTVVIAALGYVGQWMKAPKDFPTWAAKLVIAISTVAGWTLIRQPHVGHVSEWCLMGLAFSLSAWGVSSGAAAFGLAPKTDSK